MKMFTKVVLWISGIMASIGVVCVIIACCMGLNWNLLQNMARDGKFTFRFGDGNFVGWNFGYDEDDIVATEPITITEKVSSLDIEYGAGKLIICYGDVENILIEPQGVVGFATEVEEETICIEGGVNVNSDGNCTLTITIPNGMTFKNVDLEIGASSAEVTDLIADSLEIEVGAGEATIRQLDVMKLDASVGVGQLNLILLGEETDYSYSLDCGIGEIKLGNNSYGGLGASHNVNRPEAKRHMVIECGIGEVNVQFAN